MFPSRKLTKTDFYTKQCAGIDRTWDIPKDYLSKPVPTAQLKYIDRQCHYLVPDEQELCDYHLVQKYSDGMTPKVISQGCSCCGGENGYTEEQVAIFLRRALGETVVYLHKSQLE